jgi:hypothetical protein
LSLASSGRPVTARPDPAPQLCVLVGFHHLVCALPLPSIDRLTLPEAAQRLVIPSRLADAATPSGEPLPAVVQVGGERYAAWDLGLMLGLRPVAKSWVLMQVPHAGKSVPIALRAGPCLAVQNVRKLMKLPPGIFRARRAALTDGFAAAAATKGARYHASVGLWLDPARLFEASELQASATALARAASLVAPAARSHTT